MKLYDQIKELAKKYELYEEPTCGFKALFRNKDLSTILTVTHRGVVTMEGVLRFLKNPWPEIPYVLA